MHKRELIEALSKINDDCDGCKQLFEINTECVFPCDVAGYKQDGCLESIASKVIDVINSWDNEQPKNNEVHIGSVVTFKVLNPDKEQALKPLEEAAEVFAAWQDWAAYYRFEKEEDIILRENLLDECADVIQSVCNLAEALGVYDLEPYMKACEQRNRERGRL